MGLQLLNTGQRDNQINIAHNIHFFSALFAKFLFELSDIFQEIFFHKFGKIIIHQKNIKIPPLILFQIRGSTHKNKVEAFKSIEKIIIEMIRDRIIIYGLYLSLLSAILTHKITGKSGSTHGAKMVKTHAKNETNINVIIIFLLK